MPATVAAARAGVTTGEWAAALRDVFGDYRAPTGVTGASSSVDGDMEALASSRQAVTDAAVRLGVQKVRFLVAKPGLDGHSNAAEQVAVRARDLGYEVIYQGIRLTPAEIARAAADEDVHVVGLSILSGSHLVLVPDVLRRLRDEGVDVPVVVGGIIPDEDAAKLLEEGVERVLTPMSEGLTAALGGIAASLGRSG
jgi:(2R)-ethylmalonyl-CoA mutase